MDAEGALTRGWCVSTAVMVFILFIVTLLKEAALPANALPDEATVRSSAVVQAGSTSGPMEGSLVRIDGRYYVVKTADGKELYLLVNQNTDLAGTFKPGDHIVVWTSPIEHAIAIRATTQKSVSDPMALASLQLKGRLIAIEGSHYIIMGSDGKERRLLVTDSTELAGEFKPGDLLEVFTSPLEYAVTIKAAQ